MEDKRVLTGEVSYYSIAKEIGKTPAYITLIANEHRCPPERIYKEIKKAEKKLLKAKLKKLDK